LIDQQFRKFSSEYLSSSSFLPLIDDEKQYCVLRNKLTLRPTTGQSNRIISKTATNVNVEQPNDSTDIRARTSSSSTTTTTTNNKVKNYEEKLIFHYIHEKRFHSFKRDMHKLYEDYFGDPSAMNIKMIVGNCNRRSAKHELIRKRPKKVLLQNKPIKSMYFENVHTSSF